MTGQGVAGNLLQASAAMTFLPTSLSEVKAASPDVALVFPAAGQTGGVERIVWDYAHHLLKGGRRVAFVGEQLAPGHDPGLQHVRVVPARGLPAAAAFRRGAAAALVDLRPGVQVSAGAECPPGDVGLVQSVLRSWLQSARTVPVRGREVPARVRYLMPRHQVGLALERQYFSNTRTQVFACTSQREVDDLQRLYGVARDRLTVVPNGFDPAVFAPRSQPDDRRASRHALSIGQDEIVLLFLANELHRKGFGPLLHAVSLAADLRLRIDVVGKADPSSYGATINALGLQGRVHWHGPTDDAARFYALADVLVLPTQYEPFGLVIVEALATGLPVITTRLAGASDAVEPGRNGLLQEDPYDAAELAGLLREASAPGVRAEWARRAPESVRRFRHDQVFAQLDRLLDSA